MYPQLGNKGSCDICDLNESLKASACTSQTIIYKNNAKLVKCLIIVC